MWQVIRTHELNMTHARLTSLAVGALLLASVVPPAAAQAFVLRPGYSTDPADPTKIVRAAVIPLSDIDPTSPSGAAVLLDRIEAAADAACGGSASAVSRREREGYADCHRIAVAVAVAKMRSPALTTVASNRRMEAAAR
jgi:UrcA family protein